MFSGITIGGKAGFGFAVLITAYRFTEVRMRRDHCLIVGGGVVGMTLALALQRYLGVMVTLLDADQPISWNPDGLEERVSAISLASQNILQALGVWEKVRAKRISPYRGMQVWDAIGCGEMAFDQAEIDVPVLGYIVEDGLLKEQLRAAMLQTPGIQFLEQTRLRSLQSVEQGFRLTTEDGDSFETTMLFAADGAKSWVRESAGIAIRSCDYEHTAFVATLSTTLSHQQIARQCFTEHGPLAFLPLSDPHRCSIVWSVTPEFSAELRALSPEAFAIKLQTYFYDHIGKVELLGPRWMFPLYGRHAQHYVLPHLALVGDAAHTLHPLAGQGVNLGLLDVASLIKHCKRQGFTYSTLRCYERERKTDNTLMMSLVWGLKSLFIDMPVPLASLRSFGLQQVNRLQPLKKELMRVALGQHVDLTVFQ